MKLRQVNFDRYAGRDQLRRFDEKTHDIDFDPVTRLIRIAPKGGGEVMLVIAHNCDMYPEADVVEAPARPIPGRARSRS